MAATETKKRMTAKKARVSDIATGAHKPAEGMTPGYIITQFGMKVSRTRIMATVVGKFVSEDKNFASITLDDGTETIRAKSFGSTKFFDNVKIGDLVDVIGKVREYNGEIYVTLEIITKIADPNFETLRRLELIKQYKEWKNKIGLVKAAIEKHGSPEKAAEALKGEMDAEDVESCLEFLNKPSETPKRDEKEDAKNAVLAAVAELDKGDGVSYSELTAKTNVDEKMFDAVINDLLEEGTCYEPRPGQLRKC